MLAVLKIVQGNFFPGKKTYLLAWIAIATGIVNWLTDPSVTLDTLFTSTAFQDNLRIVWEGLAIIFLRKGIADFSRNRLSGSGTKSS